MTKRNKKNAWKVSLAFLVALLTPLLIAMFYSKWDVKASELIDPSQVYLSFNDPNPELPQLPANVVETIRWAFKDKGEAVVKEALLVARCESGQRVDAANTTKNKDKTRDDGVFQVNSIHGIPTRFLHDLKINVMVARDLYDASGWGPWKSSNKCHHLVK